MLRAIVLALGVIAVGAGVTVMKSGARGAGIYLLCVGAAVILGTVFERWRYRGARGSTGAHWERTGERFQDPATGEIMEVDYDRSSGERRYVRTGDSKPGS